MAAVVLVFHLIICVGLIALVLLQRSEGGALGMGGGGGGALMSGRGAADALAKMTQVAGGVFLVTSLALTMIQGAAQTSSNRSVFDNVPSIPSIQLPNFGGDEKAQPEQTPSSDPLESSAPAPSQNAAAPITVAPSAASAAERAGPVAGAAAPASAPRTTQAAAPAAPRPAASTATTRPASATTNATTTRSTTTTPRPASTTRPASGVASGVTVPVETSDDPLTVRRDSRAGPDQ